MIIAGVIGALILGFFFSGSMVACIGANRLRLGILARRTGLTGPIIRKVIDDPNAYLATCVVGYTVALVVFATLATLWFQELPGFSPERTPSAAFTAAKFAVLFGIMLLASAVFFVAGEVLPKSTTQEVATDALLVLALPLHVSRYLLLPLTAILRWAVSLPAMVSGGQADAFQRFIQDEWELRSRESDETREPDGQDDSMTLLSNVIAMSSMRVKESMVPRTDIYALEENTPIDVVHNRFVSTGHSKMPVYRENIDNVVGMAFAYDLFNRPKSLEEIVRPAKFVPELKRSRDLLQEFLATGTSIAVVIDEYGGTAGLVTREDLLEELFGDIMDEFDTDQEILRQTGDDTFTVSGRVRLDELEERFGIELPEGDYETVAGYLLDKLGTIPTAKQEFDLDSYHFSVLRASPNRVDLVRITRNAPKK